jgi:hypothetical protein
VERFERLERATVFVGTDHVEIHVDQTVMQVLVGLRWQWHVIKSITHA